MNPRLNLDQLRFDPEKGTVVVVAQDAVSGRVLMVANSDKEALERTQQTGEMHYRSRTRGLWRKGETSGNVQRVVSLAADCDGDTVLARVISAGPACHTGAPSCFDDSLATPSVWSALGPASSDLLYVRERSLIRMGPFDPAELAQSFGELEASAGERLRADGVSEADIEITRFAAVDASPLTTTMMSSTVWAGA